jgi:hypothetical protein
MHAQDKVEAEGDMDQAQARTEVNIDDVANPMIMADLEVRDVMQELLDAHEDQVEGRVESSKVVPFVQYEGHQIYKSMLVSQLNRNPFLSKNRLTRVRNSIYFNNSDEYLRAANSADTCMLGLGCDYTVYMVQRSTTRKSNVSKAVGRKGKEKSCGSVQEKNILEGVDKRTW